jgi:hypothetical protein
VHPQILPKNHLFEAVFLRNGNEALPSLRKDIGIIEEAVASVEDCRLIIIDPVSAYLGGVDDHKNSETRGILSPLKALAERTNTAIVLVSHLNKTGGTDPQQRVMGSIAYIGACISNFLFVRDKTDPSGRRVLMCDSGSNQAAVASVPTLGYVIRDDGEGPWIDWADEPVGISAREALSAETETNDPYKAAQREERSECARWLHEFLAPGQQWVVEINKEGLANGFSKDALKRAKCRIGAKTVRQGFGEGSKCFWQLAVNPSTDEVRAP